MRHETSHAPPALLPAVVLLLIMATGDGRALKDPPGLGGTRWQVEDIDAEAVPQPLAITLEIPDTNRIGGQAGCNSYSGRLEIDGDAFRVHDAVVTLRACTPPGDREERRFLDALAAVRRFHSDGAVLQLFDAEGRPRIRAVAAPPGDAADPEAAADGPLPGSAPAPVALAYRCDAGLAIEVSVVAPDAVELRLPDGTHRLERLVFSNQSSSDPGSSDVGSSDLGSSDAYGKDGITYRREGDDIVLDIGGVRHRCSAP